MITLYGKHHVHSEWAELTSQEYLGIIPILLKFIAGEIPLGEARILIFCLLGGVDPDKISREEWLTFCENVYIVSQKMKFFYKFAYNDERFAELSPKIQKELRKTLPSDLKGHEAKVAAKFAYSVAIDACFARNLLPEFKYNGVRYKGYSFELDGNIPITTLTAEQFSDSQSVIEEFDKTGKESYLDMLVSVLYKPIGDAPEKPTFNDTIRQAVYLNYQAIILWLFTQTDYAILWGDKKKSASSEVKKIHMGLRATLYSFSKQYGSFDEVKQYNLITFLDLMLYELTESIKTLAQSGLKKDEIMEKTDLPLEVINQIL